MIIIKKQKNNHIWGSFYIRTGKNTKKINILYKEIGGKFYEKIMY